MHLYISHQCEMHISNARAAMAMAIDDDGDNDKWHTHTETHIYSKQKGIWSRLAEERRRQRPNRHSADEHFARFGDNVDDIIGINRSEINIYTQ